MIDRCAGCGCELVRKADAYGSPSIEGRAHASRHHYVPERLFGRSANRRRKIKERIFAKCPWDLEGKSETFCYECHEVVLHNPVLLPEDIERLAILAQKRGLREHQKGEGYDKLAGRVVLLHDVIARGLTALLQEAVGS